MQMKPSQGQGNPAQATTPPEGPQARPGASYTPSPPLPPEVPAPFPASAPGRGLVSGWQSGNLPGGQYPETGATPTPMKRPNTDPLLNNDSMQGFFPGHGAPQRPGPNPAVSPSPAYPGNMPGQVQQRPGYVQPPASFAAPGAPPMQRPGPQPGYPLPQQAAPARPPMVLPAPPAQMPGNFQQGARYGGMPDAPPRRPNGPVYPALPGGPNGPQQGYAGGSFQQRGPAPQIMPPRWVPPSSPPPRKRKRAGRIILRVALVLLIVLLLVGGAGYWYYQQNFAQSINTITGKAAIRPQSSKLNVGTPAVQSNPNQNAMLTGGRVNIVLLGSDTDGKGNDVQNGTPLAQTVIIVTIDPQTKYVGMLSIPRDMQVTDPVSGGHPKLDEVFSYGYRGNTVSDRVASAAGRMMEAIEYNFGIHIDHYAWVGLTGFVKVIDTAGGIDVDAIHPMVDDVYPDDTGNPNGSIYDFKRLYIAPGPQHMNGLQALEYVRTRHSDLVGDFGRSQRQQQILTQLKAKLARPDIIPKAPELLKDLEGSLQTDLTLDQMYPLANYARTVDTNKIDRLTLSPPYARPSGVNTNYLPVCEQIVPKIATMFGLGNNAKCIPQVANGGTGAATVALTQPSPSTATAPASATTGSATMDNAWQLLGSLGQSVGASLSQGRGVAGIDSIHDMLDIMFCVVFESFDAMKV